MDKLEVVIMDVNLKIKGYCEEMSDLELLKAELKVFCLKHNLDLTEYDEEEDKFYSVQERPFLHYNVQRAPKTQLKKKKYNLL